MKHALLKLTGILLAAFVVFGAPAAVRAATSPGCGSSGDGQHYSRDEDRTWVIPASCLQGGMIGYTCTYCGEAFVVETPPTGHVPETSPPLNTIAPTCTQDGSYEIMTWCIVCGTELSHEIVTIPATGHSWDGGTVTKAATCTEDGSITYYCTTCGATFTQAIPATGHTPVSMPARAATCEEVGLTEGQYCSTCGEVLLYQYSSPALGHDWGEGEVQDDEGGLLHDHDIVFTCSRCGKTRAETAKVNARNFFPTLYNKPPKDGTSDSESTLKITKQPEDLELEWKEGSMGMLTIEVTGGVEPYTYKWIMMPDVTKDSSLGDAFAAHMEDVAGAALAHGMNAAVSFGQAEGGHIGAASAKPAHIGNFTTILPDKADASNAVGKALDYELIPGSAWVTETEYPELQVEVGSAAGYKAWCIVYDDNGDHVTSEKVKIFPALTIVKQPQDINFDDPEAVFSVAAAYGKEPYKYQWQYLSLGEKFVDIDSPNIDAHGPTVRPEPGMDQVRCIVTDDNKKSVTSDVAGFFFAPVLEVSGSEDLFIRPGEPAQLSASFTGGVAPYTTAWVKQGSGADDVQYILWIDMFEEAQESPVTYDLDSYDDSVYGTYVFTVEDSVGQVKEWTVDVSYRGLTIAKQPESGDLNFEGDYEVSIEMGEGTMPFTYSIRNVTHAEIDSETTSSSTWSYTLHESDIYYIYVEDASGLHAESDYFWVGDYEVKITSQPDVIEINEPDHYAEANLLVEGGEGPYTLTWYKMNEETGEYEAIETTEGYAPTVGYTHNGIVVDTWTEDWAQLLTVKTGSYILEATDANNVKGVSKPFEARYVGTKPYIIVEPQDMEFEATSGRSELTYSLDCLATTGSGKEELAYLWEYCDDYGCWQKAPLQTLYARGPQYYSYADYPHQTFYRVNHSRVYRCKVTNMATGEYTYSRNAFVRVLMLCTHAGQGGKGNNIHANFAGGAWQYKFFVREKYPPNFNDVWALDGTDGNNRTYTLPTFVQYWDSNEDMGFFQLDIIRGEENVLFKEYNCLVTTADQSIYESSIDGTVYCYADGLARRWRWPGDETGAHNYHHRVYQIMIEDWFGDTCTSPWIRMTSPMTASEKAYNIFFYGIFDDDPLISQSDHAGW